MVLDAGGIKNDLHLRLNLESNSKIPYFDIQVFVLCNETNKHFGRSLHNNNIPYLSNKEKDYTLPNHTKIGTKLSLHLISNLSSIM